VPLDHIHQLIRDSSPVGYIILDRALVVRDILGAAEDLLLISASQLVGQRLILLAETHAFAASIAALLSRIQEQKLASGRSHGHLWGQPDRPIDLHIQQHDTDGWTLCTILPAGRDGHDQATGAARKMLRGLSAMLAHEIKNPLAGIRGSAQLLGRLVKRDKKHLSTLIADEVDRIGRLIDRLAEHGSLYASGADLSPDHGEHVADVHDCANRSTKLLPPDLLSNLNIEEYFDPSLPPVLAGEDALVALLLNLLLNAARAIDMANHHQGLIIIATRYCQGRYGVNAAQKRVKLGIEVRISDNGQGIPHDLRPHIFDPFVTSHEAGSGLGLAIVRQILDEIGGQIELAKTDTDGTEFRLYLPEAPRGAVI